MSAGDWALLILAVFWAILVVVLAILSIRVFRLLDSTTKTLDDFRGELVPILTEVQTTVTTVNRNLDHADTILVSTGHITQNVERITTLVDQFVSLPLIKAISWGHGLQKGVQRFRGGA
jgi:uncharacterized protein YoxC